MRRIGQAIRDARGNVPQAELGRRIGLDQSRISQWERGQEEPSIGQLLDVERALDLEPGFLFIRAGLAGSPPATESAILADPALSRDQVDALLVLYRSFTGGKRPEQRAGTGDARRSRRQ